MFYQVQLWKGLTTPYVSAHQLNKAESYQGIWRKTTLLLLISIILTTISSYFGIGNEQLSKFIYDTSSTEFEAIKGLFAVGQVVQSTLATILIIILPALILWVFTDTEFHKLIVIQLFVAVILMVEKLIHLPLHLYFGLDFSSSPFSLGVIVQYMTDNELVSSFFGEISLFSVWILLIQYKYLRIITELKPGIILLLIVSINLLIWIFTAFFSFIKFEVLL